MTRKPPYRPKYTGVRRYNVTVPIDVSDAFEALGPHVNLSAIVTDAMIAFLAERKAGSVESVSETVSVPGVGPIRITMQKVAGP